MADAEAASLVSPSSWSCISSLHRSSVSSTCRAVHRRVLAHRSRMATTASSPIMVPSRPSASRDGLAVCGAPRTNSPSWRVAVATSGNALEAQEDAQPCRSPSANASKAASLPRTGRPCSLSALKAQHRAVEHARAGSGPLTRTTVTLNTTGANTSTQSRRLAVVVRPSRPLAPTGAGRASWRATY